MSMLCCLEHIVCFEDIGSEKLMLATVWEVYSISVISKYYF